MVELTDISPRLFQKFEKVEDRSTEPQFERCEVTMSPGAGVAVAFTPGANF